MIHLGISQQHEIILGVKALLAFWQGLNYLSAHSSDGSRCALRRVGAQYVLERMKNLVKRNPRQKGKE
jgi:hypothetical protein